MSAESGLGERRPSKENLATSSGGKLAVELVTNDVVHVRRKIAARGKRALIVARTGARRDL